MKSSVFAFLVAVMVAVLLAAGTPSARAQQSYSIKDLGSISGFMNFSGRAINASGQAAVYSDYDSGYIGHAMFYDGTTLNDLPVYPGPNLDQAFPTGINNLGWVVGQTEKGNEWDAALWKNGNIYDLAKYGEAYAVNNAASPQITGVYRTRKGDRAFLWQNDSLQTLPFSAGYGINDNGDIVGDNGGPCYWSAATRTVLALPTLGGNSQAYAINNAGQCVGSSVQPADGTCHLVLWQNGALQDEGSSPGGYFSAAGINNSGAVVFGRSQRWDPVNGFVDLSNLVDMSAFPGWNFYEVRGINDSGQITGSLMDTSGQRHAIILTPQ